MVDFVIHITSSRKAHVIHKMPMCVELTLNWCYCQDQDYRI